MKPQDLKIHNDCLRLCRGYVRHEAPIVVQLQLVDEFKIYKCAKLYPCLQTAIVTRCLTISKAYRIVSILNAENAEEVVEFAKTHTSKQIEREVRRRNPKAAVRAKIKPLTGNTDLLQSPIPRETSEHISRAQSLLAQKTSKHQGLPETIAYVFRDYVERHDPVKKAQRAQKRNSAEYSAHAEKRETFTHAEKATYSARAEKTTGRTAIPAAARHMVDLRDEGRCTHIGKDGKRCNADRWTHYHHIIRVADGGSSHPDNLTTLCSFHHDLVHQQVFPLDGEMSWLRSPERAYRVRN
jgi:hypothetical protein